MIIKSLPALRTAIAVACMVIVATSLALAGQSGDNFEPQVNPYAERPCVTTG